MIMKRLSSIYTLTGAALIFLFYFRNTRSTSTSPVSTPQFNRPPPIEGTFQWTSRPEKYRVSSLIPLPSGPPVKIPSIQHKFSWGSGIAQEERRQAVKETFNHAWEGYQEHAWLKDELAPVSGGSRSHFGGWAATLVDSLDTLWIMGLKAEFEAAVESVGTIDFTTTDEEEINVFETTIRYLGGLLAGYDLSGHEVLLKKAVELGDFLYAAFDTPDRMPITRWKWKTFKSGEMQKQDGGVLVAEIGSLSLEFTRLSQLTGDEKFFDAIQRISDLFEKSQNKTRLPGMWPVVVSPQNEGFGLADGFTLGAMADSTYEYLPKACQYMLLGGLSQQYRTLYETAIETAKNHLFFRPMTPQEEDILISGGVRVLSPNEVELDPQGQHLACFVGGMMGIGARVFERPEDLAIAQKLVNGCIWAYQSMPSGIMPETFHVVPCQNSTSCEWDEKKWHAGIASRNKDFKTGYPESVAGQINKLGLLPGFTDIPDRRYILRPEAIESIFILYRITGDESLRDTAWAMFQSIRTHTRTAFGNTALNDVTKLPPSQSDSMESFWTAETLKYFYLIFSETWLIDLDDFIFNTEAHTLRRPQ